ncbi:MAG: hypothetical protein EOM21_21495 [Gammaproteobacteria bacterium]|nr:hypothetical protein [Gammaproteobacteria bacterium]
MIKATVKGKLSFPDFGVDLSNQLMTIATKEIIPDIEKRIDKGIDVNDRRYKILAQSTVKAKMKKGQWAHPLIATGQLRSSIEAKKYGKSVIIEPQRTRRDGLTNSQLGDILQNQGVRTKNGKRYFEFFGISKQAEERSIQSMKKFIDRTIKNARPRTI